MGHEDTRFLVENRTISHDSSYLDELLVYVHKKHLETTVIDSRLLFKTTVEKHGCISCLWIAKDHDDSHDRYHFSVLVKVSVVNM